MKIDRAIKYLEEKDAELDQKSKEERVKGNHGLETHYNIACIIMRYQMNALVILAEDNPS